MQIQDMKGQAGDRTRGRRSVPLTLEDLAARWTIAVPVLTWFIICPLFLSLRFLRYLATGGFGSSQTFKQTGRRGNYGRRG